MNEITQGQIEHDLDRLLKLTSNEVGTMIMRIMATSYMTGGLRALELYAYWEDGVQHVGSTGVRLADARKDWKNAVIHGMGTDKPTTEEKTDE